MILVCIFSVLSLHKSISLTLLETVTADVCNDQCSIDCEIAAAQQAFTIFIHGIGNRPFFHDYIFCTVT